jgi:hypothetical protein
MQYARALRMDQSDGRPMLGHGREDARVAAADATNRVRQAVSPYAWVFHLAVCPSTSERGASFTEKTAMIAAAQKKASDNAAHANAMFR